MSHQLTRTDLRDHTFTTYLASSSVAGGSRKRLIGTAYLANGRVTFRVEVGGVTVMETGNVHTALEAYNAAGQELADGKSLDSEIVSKCLPN
jgi:hypothetical protein